ncbi:unnamed protein product [Arctogadus glacialis]
MDRYSAVGPDKFPAIILKECGQVLAPVVTQLWRASLDSGDIAAKFKSQSVWFNPRAHSYSKMYHQLFDSLEYIDLHLRNGLDRISHEQPNCGQTYVMYHGTTWTNATTIQRDGFKQSKKGMLGRGVYLSCDLKKASRYPINTPHSERVVLMVEVNVGNVIAINHQGHPRQKNWHDRRFKESYDTAWCPPDCGMTRSGLEEDCVWDPNRIKIVKCIAPITRSEGSERSEGSGGSEGSRGSGGSDGSESDF